LFYKIYDFYTAIGVVEYAEGLTYFTLFLGVLIAAILARFLVNLVLVKVISKTAKKTKTQWDNILLENQFFQRISNLAIPIVLSMFTKTFTPVIDIWDRAVGLLVVIFVVFIITSSLNAIEEIYRGYEIYKTRPIKGVLQVVNIINFIIGGVVAIALLVGESPVVLLGGIGAMTAVTSLIFKDAILGFVAGIQLTGNDMVRIGDWIEVPNYSANGTVVDMSLTTVKVENFDNTITTVPAYAMITNAFINWRGMEDSGGRRIKRSLYINVSDVRFADQADLDYYEEIDLLADYIKGRRKEIGQDNQRISQGPNLEMNRRRLTNLGTFRVYVEEYIKHHPDIRKDTTLMVRQLGTEGQGIPLEIYAFANTTDWVKYEEIQANIFDHLYAIATEFGLTLFQNPSGNDVRKLGLVSNKKGEE
jgi:miniconductance mechanosensitive channel